MNTDLQLRIAYQLGKNGFDNGKQAPAQDKNMLNMLRGMKIGDMDGVELLDSWNFGWNQARESTEEYKQMLIDVFGKRR